jgi:hypothetical protein
MTERQWWRCTDPNPMLAFLSRTGCERKRRLLACAFCQDSDKGISDAWYWRAIDLGARWTGVRAALEPLGEPQKGPFFVIHFPQCSQKPLFIRLSR